MKQKGFTLVEMLVALGIFSVFMGVLITSYISLVKGFRGTEDYRVLYADARNVFDTVIEHARNSTVYGDCNDISDGGFIDDLSTLSFCSTDGVKKVTFVLEEESNDVLSGLEVTDEQNLNEESARKNLKMVVEEIDNPLMGLGYSDSDTTILNSDSVNIKNFSFKVFPKTDPFLGVYNDVSSYQPVVIIDATFEKVSASGSTYSLPLHTAISLRTYK